MNNQPVLREIHVFQLPSSVDISVGSARQAITKPQRSAMAKVVETHCVRVGGTGEGDSSVRVARAGVPAGSRRTTRKTTWRFGEITRFFPRTSALETRAARRARSSAASGGARNGTTVDRVAERGEGDRGRTHVDAKHAVSGDVEREPFHGAHEAHHLLLIGEVDVGVLVAAADLFETDHRARKRVVSPKRSSVEAKGVSVTPAVALRCDRPNGFCGKMS